jgi:hypothetical protein
MWCARRGSSNQVDRAASYLAKFSKTQTEMNDDTLVGAILVKDVDGVRNAINQNVDLNAVITHDNEQLTPLVWSVSSSPTITAMLLRAGADPDQVVTNGATNHSALSLALERGDCDNHISLLLAAGADPNAVIDGESLLSIAFRSDEYNYWPLLFAAGAVWNNAGS